jgi:hypothetical protein
MPTDFIVLAAITAAFVVFALTLSWADFYTHRR